MSDMNKQPEYAIQVNNVSKVYKLYEKNSDRFKEAMGFGRHSSCIVNTTH